MNITCPNCGAASVTEESFAGQQIACQQCGTLVNTPTQIEVTPVQVEAVEAVAVEPVAVEAVPVDTGHVAIAAPAVPVPVSSADADEEDDGGFFGAPKNRDDSELDMTPMVDVTFLLLIFFMVTASFSLQKSITMPREQSDAPSTTVVDEEEEDSDLVTVQIDEFNSFVVVCAEFEREVPGKQNLIRALREAKPEEADKVTLKIEVHENAVIEAVIDAMDAGAGLGFTEIQKTEIKDF